MLPRSASPSSQDDGSAKPRRQRKALSCTSCHARKIKCDRNVPRCSSCVARGIEMTCRWGDERDDHLTGGVKGITDTISAAVQEGDRISGGGAGPAGVDSIVEAVLKRLKRRANDEDDEGDHDDDEDLRSSRKSKRNKNSKPPIKEAHLEPSSQSLDTNSQPFMQMVADTLNYTRKPPPYGMTNPVPVSAFKGSSISHPLRMAEHSRHEQLDAEVVRSSLRCLPTRQVTDRLVTAYFEEVEPYRSVFNHVLLRQQIEEFWQGVDELGVQVGTYEIQAKPKDTQVATPVDFAFNPSKDSAKTSDSKQDYALCNRGKQGLIAVIFGLLDVGARTLGIERLKEMKAVPSEISEETMLDWSDMLSEHSMRHLTLSNYLQIPTLWSLQTMLMAQNRWLDARISGRPIGLMSLAVSLAVNMGLNRLGSAYDDLERAGEEDEDGGFVERKMDVPTLDKQDAGKNLLTDIRYGTLVSNFEDGNLGMRELGRKVWCSILGYEYLVSGHLDHFYSAHDSINFTSPPAPIDDDEALSKRAPILLAKARMGSHKPSENDFARIWLAMVQTVKAQIDVENLKGMPMAFEDIMMVDKLWLDVMDAIPDSLRFRRGHSARYARGGYVPEDPVTVGYKSTDPIAKGRRIALQIVVLHDQIHFRRLRLHRLLFGKGLKDAKYRPCASACLEAARAILAARQELEDNKLGMWSKFVLTSHLFHAALVFQLVLLFEIDRRRGLQKGSKKTTGTSVDTASDHDVFQLDDFEATLKQLDNAVFYLQKYSSKHPHFSTLLPGFSSFLSGVQEHILKQQVGRRDNVVAGQNRDGRPSDQNGRTSQQGGESGRGQGGRGSSSRRMQSSRVPTSRSRGASKNDATTDAATILASIPSLVLENPSISSRSPSLSQSANTPSTSLSTSSPRGWGGMGMQQLQFYPPQGSLSDSTDANVLQQQAPFFTSTSNFDTSNGGNMTTFDAFDPSMWSLEALFPDYAQGEIDLIGALERSLATSLNTQTPIAQSGVEQVILYPNYRN